MKKVQPGEVQGLVDFTSPDRKTITFEKHIFKEYLPSSIPSKCLIWTSMASNWTNF